MPDKKQQPPKKKPIVVSDKNDPRYKAYQDSLNLYNNYKANKELIEKGQKFYPTVEVGKPIKDNVTRKEDNPNNDLEYKKVLSDFGYNVIGSKGNPQIELKAHKKIKPIALETYTRKESKYKSEKEYNKYKDNIKDFSEKPKYANWIGYGLSKYKEPEQPVLLEEKPREKQTPISTIPLDVQPINSNLEIKTSELSPIARVPKKYRVETSGGGKFGGWSRTEEVTDFDNISADKGNKRLITPIYALGGNIKQQTNNMNNITTYNEGGLHETNPNGGIPMGTNPEGVQNTVEEGEARMGDMIYSNRIPLSQEAVEAVGLPRKFIGKTPGDILSLIDKTFKDRNDQPSQATKKDIADKVAQAQEMIKAQQEAMQTQSQEVPDMMNGQVPQGMEEFTQNQMSFGGFFQGQQGQQNMSMIGVGARTMGQGMTQGPNTVIAGDPNDNQMVDGTKDAVASAIGPIGQMFRGIQKMGQGVGNSIGGAAGAGVADAFSPEESTIAMWKDKDASMLEKAGGTVPILGGVLAFNAKEEKANRERIKQNKIYNSQFTSDFAYGGPFDKASASYDPTQIVPEYTQNIKLLNNIFQPKGRTTNNPLDESIMKYGIPPTQPIVNYGDQNVESKKDINWNKIGEQVNKNYPHALRLAPIGMNALELARLKKNGYDKVNPILNDTRFKPEYIDEKSLTNLANSEMNNTINEISESGGSQGAVRNAILGAGLNRNKALSQAMIDAQAKNIATNQMGQQFNNQINEANIQRRAIAEDLTARNKGAYETNRSKLVGQLGTDIGSIGKEEVFKDIAENMTGYDWLGNYLKINPNATKEQVIQAYKAEQKSKKNPFQNRPTVDTSPITTGAYGGKMKFKKY